MKVDRKYKNVDLYKIDPYTGEEFEPMRSNQRFANRKNQIAYNNAKASKLRSVKAPRLKALNENYKVLLKILKKRNNRIVSKDFLLGAGFDFKSSSSAEQKGEGEQRVYQYIYDLRIRIVFEDFYEVSFG